MTRKLALKRLKHSDLSFFQSYLLQMSPQNKQKGFNLDRSIIVDRFFPMLPNIAEANPEKRSLVSLALLGPNGMPRLDLARKIKKEQKNWRLNGEVIYDPDGQPNRFANLRPDDYAIFDFVGEAVPDLVKVLIISVAAPRDSRLHSAISQVLPTTSMRVISELEIESLIQLASPDHSHPILDWVSEELLEDVALGGYKGASRLNSRRTGRGMSQAELRAAKATAEATGMLGEELFDFFLRTRLGGNVSRHIWESKRNAISAYDFEVVFRGHKVEHVDVKSTVGGFGNSIHVSWGELNHAANSAVPYRIARIYELTPDGGNMRFSEPVNQKFIEIVDSFDSIPNKVTVDSVAISPSILNFPSEVYRLNSEDGEA